jgi:outer membrane lipoprotein SlyB
MYGISKTTDKSVLDTIVFHAGEAGDEEAVAVFIATWNERSDIMVTVLAIYDDREKARQAVATLLEEGVTEQCLSVVTKKEHLPSRPPKEQEGVKEDLAVGAAAGSVVGLLTGSVVVLASGIGPLAVTGALVAALGGAASGSLLGLLAGYSISEEEATGYEKALDKGHVLVFVHGDPRQVAQAQTVFEAGPPCMIHSHGEAPDEISKA